MFSSFSYDWLSVWKVSVVGGVSEVSFQEVFLKIH